MIASERVDERQVPLPRAPKSQHRLCAAHFSMPLRRNSSRT